MILDGKKIRALRIQAGLSTRDMSRHLGISTAAVSGIETRNSHRNIQLGLLVRIAQLLNVEPNTLFLCNSVSRPDASDEPTPATDLASDDATKVGAALAEADTRIRREDLAHALQMSPGQTKRAVDVLEARLRGTGLTVHNIGRTHRLVPQSGALSDEQRVLVARAAQRRAGLTPATAKVLYSVVCGDSVPVIGVHQGGQAQAVIGRLLRLDLVRDQDGMLALGDDIRFAIDELSTSQ
jgi:transcriptional regulator with XRE-family HTH domain